MNSTGAKIVIWLVVAALALGGLGSVIASVVNSGPDSSALEPIEVEPGSEVAPDPALAKFYGQPLAWGECGDFVCAALEVPLDYSDPAGQTIDIAVLRVPASGDRRGSLVVNPGGPGAPGTEYAALYQHAFGSSLHEHYDIVGFDPRGTGSSAPIDCLSDADLIDYIASDPDPDTPQEVEATFATSKKFGQGCADLSGAVAGHVSTQEAARDMDILRSSLGQNELTYFGASYGTHLGAMYADIFPSKVGRFVLDGAIDPSLSSMEDTLQQAAGFQTALDAYINDCLDAEDCFLGPSLGAAQKTISTLLDELDQEPLPTDSDRVLTQGEAFLGIAMPLYAEDFWGSLTEALERALDGDGSDLLTLADQYSSRVGDTFVDNSMEAIFAINCLDDPFALTSAAEVEKVMPQFIEASPTFGRTFAWMTTGCSGLAVEPSLEPRTIEAKGAAPIMVIGTTRDPATPIQWAEAMAAQLDSGFLVVRDGDGHTAYNSDNACIDETVESYLLEGTIPDAGLTC